MRFSVMFSRDSVSHPRRWIPNVLFSEPRVRIPPGFLLVNAARDKNVRRQRIVFAPHFVDGCIHFAHSVAECREGILQAMGRIGSHEHSFLPLKVKHRPLDAQTPHYHRFARAGECTYGTQYHQAWQ